MLKESLLHISNVLEFPGYRLLFSAGFGYRSQFNIKWDFWNWCAAFKNHRNLASEFATVWLWIESLLSASCWRWSFCYLPEMELDMTKFKFKPFPSFLSKTQLQARTLKFYAILNRVSSNGYLRRVRRCAGSLTAVSFRYVQSRRESILFSKPSIISRRWQGGLKLILCIMRPAAAVIWASVTWVKFM